VSYWKTYTIAHSIDEALNALANAPGEARPIAGGSDLLLDLQQGRLPPLDTLVDVTHIPEMCTVEERTDYLFVGAGLPISQVVAAPLVRRHAPALIDAASLIGGPQVRNTATLGGNVAHALPAADGMIALLALDALTEVASLQGRRLVPLIDLFLGPGKSALHPRRDILAGFHLPLRKIGQGSAFQRIMRPQGVAIAILNMAVWLERQDDSKIADIRISVGPAGPTPFRARRAEETLKGREPDPDLLKAGYYSILSEARFRTSPHRATEEYRRSMAGVLFNETFEKAWERAV
jgi:CO/xanthine dehydrogenase FAD-binding subunit